MANIDIRGSILSCSRCSYRTNDVELYSLHVSDHASTTETKDKPEDSWYKVTGYEPLDIARAWDLDGYETKVIKYTLRWPFKGKGVEDLKKARQILSMLIEQVEKGYVPLRGRK